MVRRRRNWCIAAQMNVQAADALLRVVCLTDINDLYAAKRTKLTPAQEDISRVIGSIEKLHCAPAGFGLKDQQCRPQLLDIDLLQYGRIYSCKPYRLTTYIAQKGKKQIRRVPRPAYRDTRKAVQRILEPGCDGPEGKQLALLPRQSGAVLKDLVGCIEDLSRGLVLGVLFWQMD